MHSFTVMNRVHVFLLFQILSVNAKKSGPTVQTNVGIFEGITRTLPHLDNLQVDVFYGIRYAKQPTGSLRFKEPESPETFFDQYFKVDKPRTHCPQLADPRAQERRSMRIWAPFTQQNEDCLFLNVWVPRTRSGRPRFRSGEKLAVVVWIYGGSFYSGASTLDIYDGAYMAAHQDIIFVSMDYRLHVFGFLYFPEGGVNGNMALWDQRLALKWVKDNIASFGGDPDNITLMGESAGAVSVSAHVLSPWSHNLFKNAIMHSGTVHGYWGLNNNQGSLEGTKHIMKLVGCTHSTAQAAMHCMRQKSMQELNDAFNQMFTPSTTYFDTPFQPVADSIFLPFSRRDDLTRLRTMKPTGSMLLGVNKNEASYFFLYAFVANTSHALEIKDHNDLHKKLAKVLDIGDEPDFHLTDLAYFEYAREHYHTTDQTKMLEILEEFASDRTFKCPVIEFAQGVSRRSRDREIVGLNERDANPVYFYEFNYRTESNDMPEWLGTMHGYELEYVFGMPFSEKFQSTFYRFKDHERQLSATMMTYWGNFIRTGDPNIDARGRHVTDVNPTLPVDSGLQQRLQAYEERLPPDPQLQRPVMLKSRGGAKPAKTRVIAWPRFTNTTEAFIRFGEKNAALTTGKKPRQRSCHFLDKILITSMKTKECSIGNGH